MPKDRQLFALALAEGATKGEAAAEAFGVNTSGSASVRGSLVSREPDVQLAVNDLLAQVGLTRRRRAERLADMIECGDLSNVGRGLELSYKLDRSLVEVVEHRYSADDIRSLQALIPDDPPQVVIDITPTA